MGCLTTKEVTFHSLKTAGLFASLSGLPGKFLKEAYWSRELEPQAGGDGLGSLEMGQRGGGGGSR